MEPVPQEELPILESLINIRNRLAVLKKDRGDFIKTSDVLNLYHQTVKQVTKLNDVRDEQPAHKNRVDSTLSDVFSLLSLFFLTIGKTRECPATYCQISTIRRLLDHMNESAVYNEIDLVPFNKRLEELHDIVRSDTESGKHPVAMTKLLDRQLKECDRIVASMRDSLSDISVELVPIHEKLVTIRRQLVALAAKDTFSKAELKPIQEELRKIDSKRVDGKFLGPGGASVPTSQALCSSLLEECFEIAQEIKAREDTKNVPFGLKPVYDRLSEMRAELENLVLTRRWSLRETDLYNYTVSLQEIDKMRVDGKFVDAEGNRPAGQYILLYLLRRCYGLIYRLLSSSEPVSEELMPIANKLSTVKKCLNEVLKYGGPFNPRDLYPYQLALFQIDSLRKEGKFVSEDGGVPEGQGVVMAHLNECHELVEELKEAMNDPEDTDDMDDLDDAGDDDEDGEEED
ncbi:uncharacterized protein FOMMEDRAFT_16036 [Fomitiporia mediterranea MF3/22]|uniref:uncharacterized protein n=1 Tax=Fomitiporia mediterranea (strain MF3/22) TaxID=694068 RepID=UPI000440985F|nr:uncharacterized protein FOMMEDRAFT_16036 [Fomitiporia mediterranea MF3/22]EJD07338.1 hypothetical protein FOMMEDRAFT_16036 [Fomitiporia mediterranea MF3/22]